MSRNHLGRRVRGGATQPTMTVKLDDETAKVVENVLRANTDAIDKRSGIYWPEEEAEEMESAREQIASQLDD